MDICVKVVPVQSSRRVGKRCCTFRKGKFGPRDEDPRRSQNAAIKKELDSLGSFLCVASTPKLERRGHLQGGPNDGLDAHLRPAERSDESIFSNNLESNALCRFWLHQVLSTWP